MRASQNAGHPLWWGGGQGPPPVARGGFGTVTWAGSASLSAPAFRGECTRYTGYILIAVNPYKALPIYDNDLMFSYKGKSIGVLVRRPLPQPS